MVKGSRFSAPIAAAIFILVLCLIAAPVSTLAADGVTVWRAYNKWSGEHLFTTSRVEYDAAGKNGWRLEGEAWVAPTSGDPVYRLSNPYTGDHHYTTSRTEYDQRGDQGWIRENVAFYSAPSTGKPIYRLFNPYVKVGTHHYSTSLVEYAQLGSAGWQEEIVGWYGLGTPDPLPSDWITVSGTLYKTTYGQRARELRDAGICSFQGHEIIFSDTGALNYLDLGGTREIWSWYRDDHYSLIKTDALRFTNLNLSNFAGNQRHTIAINQRTNVFYPDVYRWFGMVATEVAILS